MNCYLNDILTFIAWRVHTWVPFITSNVFFYNHQLCNSDYQLFATLSKPNWSTRTKHIWWVNKIQNDSLLLMSATLKRLYVLCFLWLLESCFFYVVVKNANTKTMNVHTCILQNSWISEKSCDRMIHRFFIDCYTTCINMLDTSCIRVYIYI